MESALFGLPPVAAAMAKKMPEEAAGKQGFSPFSYPSRRLESSQNPLHLGEIAGVA